MVAGDAEAVIAGGEITVTVTAVLALAQLGGVKIYILPLSGGVVIVLLATLLLLEFVDGVTDWKFVDPPVNPIEALVAVATVA